MPRFTKNRAWLVSYLQRIAREKRSEGGTPAPTPQRYVTHRNSHLTTSATTTRPRQIGRWHFGGPLPKAVKRFRLCWENWSAASSANHADNINTVPIDQAFLEWEGVGVVRVTFGGANGIVVPIGANLESWSDYITPALFGSPLSAFPAGTQLFVKFDCSVPTSGRILYSSANTSTVWGNAGLSGTYSRQYDPAVTTITNLSGAGQVTTTGTTPTVLAGMPWPLAIGEMEDPDVPALVFRGDSLTAGALSWAQQIATLMGVPSCNLAVSGAGSSLGTTSVKYKSLYQFANHGLIGPDNNDWPASVVATIKARQEASIADMKAMGCETVGIMECPPQTISSNDWIDAAGQTVEANYGPGSNVYLYNAALPTFIGADYVISTSAVRDASDSYKWKTNGFPSANSDGPIDQQNYNYDRQHPTTLGHKALAEDNVDLVEAETM